MLNDLAVVGKSGVMKRRVSFVILNINECFLNASKILHDFEVTVLAAKMKGCFSRLSASIDFRQLFNEDLNKL